MELKKVKLVSPELENVIKNLVYLTDVTTALPFHWDGRLHLRKNSKWTHVWKFNMLLVLLYTTFLLVRLPESVKMKNKVLVTTFHMLMLITYLMVSALYINTYWKSQDICTYFNEVLNFCNHFQRNYIKENAPVPKIVQKIEILMRYVVYLYAPFLVVISTILAERHYHFPYLISSLSISIMQEWRILRILIVGIQSWLYFLSASIVCVYGMMTLPFGIVAIVISKEATYNRKSELTKDSLRESSMAKYCWIRYCQYLMAFYTDCFATIVMPMFALCIMSIAILSNCGVVKTHGLSDTIGFERLLFVSLSVFSMAYTLVGFGIAGKISKTSTASLRSWKKCPDKNARKFIKSCKPFLITLGSFGAVTSLTPYIYTVKIIQYSGKIVIAFS